MAIVPPNFTPRLAATGNGVNLPTTLSNAKSFAASTFTTVASINPAPVMKITMQIIPISHRQIFFSFSQTLAEHPF
ncbi:MAG TPA: hypothetical protein VF492_11855 [Verrucomicrobiae bacterium]